MEKKSIEQVIIKSEIAKATFGLTPNEHAKLKGLEKQNLRDHMTNLELVFTALGEEITRQLAIKDNAHGFAQNHDVALQGGTFAGNSRKRLEKEKGLKVVSSDNFLGLKENKMPSNTLPEEENKP
jgi:DNA-damage-inducible protein D